MIKFVLRDVKRDTKYIQQNPLPGGIIPWASQSNVLSILPILEKHHRWAEILTLRPWRFSQEPTPLTIWRDATDFLFSLQSTRKFWARSGPISQYCIDDVIVTLIKTLGLVSTFFDESLVWLDIELTLISHWQFLGAILSKLPVGAACSAENYQ